MTSTNGLNFQSSRIRTENRGSRLAALSLIWFLWDAKGPTPLFVKSRGRRPRWCGQLLLVGWVICKDTRKLEPRSVVCCAPYGGSDFDHNKFGIRVLKNLPQASIICSLHSNCLCFVQLTMHSNCMNLLMNGAKIHNGQSLAAWLLCFHYFHCREKQVACQVRTSCTLNWIQVRWE